MFDDAIHDEAEVVHAWGLDVGATPTITCALRKRFANSTGSLASNRKSLTISRRRGSNSR